MEIQTNNETIILRWRHRPAEANGVRLTECHGYTQSSLTGNRLLFGFARCSEKDNFSRKIGRKISLTRAVRKLPKETRTKIWKEYLSVNM